MRDPGSYRLYLIFSGAVALLFALIFTITAVYRVQVVGLNPLQLVLVGTVLELTYFAFNVPTGIVADLYSRRLSVIAGMFLFGAGFILEGSVPVFAAILIAQVIEGLAYTFMEGALEAWITDEVGEENVGRAFLRGGQIGGIAGFVGIFASVALASARLSLPIVVGGALFLVLGVYLILTMRETGFKRPPREQRSGVTARVQEALGEIMEMSRTGLGVARRRPLALTILAVALVFGGSSEGFDRLWEAHFLQSIGLPNLYGLDTVVWFAVINAGSILLGIAAAEVVRRRTDLASPTANLRALFVVAGLLVCGIVGFALAGGFLLALAAYWLGATMRSLQVPMYNAWINQGLEPRVRATVISMSGQADALGQFTVGPGLGVLGTAFGLRTALTAAGLALSPALLLYGRALGRSGTDPVQTR